MSALEAFFTRLPVFDRAGCFFACELVYKADDLSLFGDDEKGFLGFNIKKFIGETRTLIYFTDEMLKAELYERFLPDILTVVVTKRQLESEKIREKMAELKDKGYSTAMCGAQYGGVPDEESFKNIDLVKIDLEGLRENVEELAAACRAAGKPMLAAGVQTREDHEFAKKLGCGLTSGFYFAVPSADDDEELKPLPVSVMQAMKIMAGPEPEVNDLIEALSKDSAICQKILRLINSAYFGLSNKISTINQAIVVLGIDYLREWIYLLAVQRFMRNDSAESLKMSMLMAGFCRDIALEIPAAKGNSDSFYLMGLLSMLVFGGEKSLSKKLDQFPITNEIKRGLLRKGGVYSDVLDMALCYIRGDWTGCAALAGQYSVGSVSDIYIKSAEEADRRNIG